MANIRYMPLKALFILGMFLVTANAWAQYSISGGSCVFPGAYPFSPYQISGNIGPNAGAGDKWCITNGTINGAACFTNPGMPVCPGVSWNSGVTSGTLSYYRPASSSTPVATITVTIINPGSIGPAFTPVPSGTPVTVTCTGTDVIPSCGSGPVMYQWQKQVNGVYTNIPGGTGRDYTETGTFTLPTFFWRQVTYMGMTVYNSGGPAFVNPVTPHNPGTIGPSNQALNIGVTPQVLTQLTPASGGQYGPTYNYYWQNSTDNINFQDIPGASNAGAVASNYQPGPLPQTTYFRLRVGNGPLQTGVYTNVATIVVFAPLEGGVITPSTAVIPYNTLPGIINGTPAKKGMCIGNYSYQWEKSENGTMFTTIAGAIGQTYSPPSNLVVTTWYRRKVTLSCDGAIAYSNIVSINVTNPTDNANYIRERMFKRAGIMDLGTGDYISNLREVLQSTQYLDGIGRNIQKVIRKGSMPTDLFNTNSSAHAKDMVDISEYDNMSRESVKYLPFPANDNLGTLKSDPKVTQGIFMQAQYGNQNESYFYSQRVFEASPLGRLTKTMPQGVNWVGSNRGTQSDYFTNTVIDDVQMWRVDNSSTYGVFSTYASEGAYLPGLLYKTISTDEKGKQVIDFKDKDDKLILKKIQLTAAPDPGSGSSHTNWLCTYYIYDDLDRLRCVVQPRGVELISGNWQLTDIDVLAEQCYRYEFDSRGRLIMKKVPGADPVYMVYDNRDRLVMTQDANMRAGGTPKWSVTLYDNNNRPIETGLWDNSQSLTTHIDAAMNPVTTDYPFPASAVPGSGYENLSKAGFDNYLGIPAASSLTSTFDNTWSSLIFTNYNSFPEFAQEPAASNRTEGLVTWTQVKILNSNPVKYIYTVNIYDDRGRIIQSKARNITGGEDVATTQYNFTGQPLIMVVKQEKAGIPVQTNTIATKNTYDDLGRILFVHKKVGNSLINGGQLTPEWKFIVRNQYNALGQVSNREIGGIPSTHGYDQSGMPVFDPGAPMELQELQYNVRGWLTGLNKAQFSTQFYPNKFGYELAYDKNENVMPGQIYNSDRQYNGNIMGMTWRSVGDNEKRKYEFTYDVASRLLKADFTQFTGGTFNKSAGVDFTTQVGDGTTAVSAYDANGNIQGMKQWGLKLGSSTVVDDFNYTYKNNSKSNRLLAVTESTGIGTTDFKLGDFTDKNTTQDDYDYDGNGNMKYDKNKSISAITYNYLNLPQQITVTGKGTIKYIYDASGGKQQKITEETNATVPYNGTNYPNVAITTTTTYIGGLVYETKLYGNPALASLQYNDRLLYIPHEEGRIRFLPADPNTCPVSTDRLVYDYFLRDHLGNVRLVLTEQNESICYIPATIEDARRVDELKIYDIKAAQEKLVSQVSGADAYAQFENKFYKVTADPASPGLKTGLGMAMKVMSGDKVALSVQSYYNHVTPQNGIPDLGIPELLGSLINSSAIVSDKGPLTTTDISNIGTNTSQLTDYLVNHTPTANAPKAYLNWILFDDQLKYVNGGSDPVGGGGYKFHNKFMFDQLPVNVTQNGYLYVYVSNETPNINVYFDNLTVTHKPGPLLEETHYYPFGLTMEGISSKAALKQDNKIEYSGKEKQEKEFFDGQGLSWYDYGARMYDMQTARWSVIDPKAGKAYSWTPYNYTFNNPMVMTDPDGMWADYYTVDGEHLGNDGIEDNKAFLTTRAAWQAFQKRVKELGWDNKQAAQMLQFSPDTKYINMPANQFRTSANIVKHEGITNDRDEYLWIAHATNNAAKISKWDFYRKIMSGYSSVKPINKVPMKDNVNTPISRFARAAMIDVMTGNPDPTAGATLWDGTDFLAWGLKSPNGTPQNKFEEYYHITISQTIFYSYLNSNKNKYGETVPYKGVKYALPAAVFTVQSNWDVGTESKFSYKTGSTRSQQITATGAHGLSIFWRVSD